MTVFVKTTPRVLTIHKQLKSTNMQQNYLFKTLRLSVIGFILTLSINSFAQLSGSYTINPYQSASSTNYQSWASAISDLLSGSRSDGGSASGPGVSSNVTFTVVDTVFNSVVIDFTAVSGASPSKRITFKSSSNNPNRCVLKNASSSSTSNDFVVQFNGVDYVTFQGIGFERTGTAANSTVVRIGNDAKQLSFKNCFFKGKKEQSGSNGFQYAIGSCVYIYGNADSAEFINSRMLYGYNGVFCSSTASNNLLFSGNVFDTSGSSGIYITNQTNLKIIGNTFNMGDFGANSGHYVSYGMRVETSPSVFISKNKVIMSAVNCTTVRGIILASCTSSDTAPAMVVNNWVFNSGGTGDCTGIAQYSCNYLNFVYNNVLINSSATIAAAYYHYTYASSYIKLINNNLISKGSGYVYSVSGTNTADLDSVDYNNTYSNGTYFANWGGTNYSTFAAFKSASSKDANSLNVDPGYISNTNLHVSNIGLNKKGLKYPWVLDDIDGELRDTSTPDIGADEFFPVNLDAGVSSVDSPMMFCAGTRNVKVKFQNYGIDTIKSIKIQWSVNGTAQSTYNWTGSLASGGSSSSLQLGSYAFQANTPYTIKAWTVTPNNTTDGKKNNDTLTIVRTAGMSGTYKISDSTNADFKSFNAAISAYSSRGICGPITFKVAPGVYREQITLVQMPGMSSSNPIKFESMSKDSTEVVVTLPSTSATGNNNAAIQLRGADHVHFKSITFERTGTNALAQVVHILNGSNNNSFSNCQMIGLKLTGVNPTAINIWSDAGQDDNNVFKNNYVKFGHNNVSYVGLSTGHEVGTVFSGNTFDSAYNSAVFVAYNDGVDFSNNTFKRVIAGVTGNYSLQLSDCDNAIKINANKFYDQNAESSAMLIGCNAASNATGVVSNNFFAKASGKAIVLDGVDYQTVAFNSIYLTAANSANYGVYSTVSTTTNVVMRSNNMVLEGGQAYFFPTVSQLTASSYNNLLIKGGSFAYLGTTYVNLNDLQVGTSKEQNTIGINPFFKSTTDLHIINPLMKGVGGAITGITTDIDGETRNSTNPDIGADEFKLADYDAGIVDITGPGSGACAGVQNIEVVIHNFGGDTLTSLDINWMVGVNTQSTYKWTGSLLNKQNDTFVIGTWNFVGNLNPKFTIWSSNPNGNTDAIAFNDTLIMNKSVRSLPNANAGNDVTICNGDIANIGPNPLTGLTYKWYDLGANLIGNTAKLAVNPTTQTTYVLEVTNSTFGCKKSDTVVVFVNPTPVANAGPDKSVCYGNSVQIGAASQSGFNYSWASIPSGYSSTVSNPTVTTLQTIRYVITKTAIATGCYDTDTVLVNVVLPPKPQISGAASSCEGERFLYSTPGASGNTFVWSITGGQIISGQNTNSINVKWTGSGNGNLSVIQTNSTGCKDTVGYNILIYARPKAKFGFTNECLGGTTAFTDSSVGASSYLWNFGNKGASLIKNPTVKYDSAKTYDVRLIVSGTGNCLDTAFRSVTVYPLPEASFNSVKTAGLTYAFTDASSGGAVTWEWKMGDGNTYTTQNVQHKYDVSKDGQVLTVELCVTTDKGCKNCYTKQLNVTEIVQVVNHHLVVFPNPSTDKFNVVSDGNVKSYKLFNAQGQLVMEADIELNEFAVDLATYASGVYQLIVQTDTGQQSIKIIKQ